MGSFFKRNQEESPRPANSTPEPEPPTLTFRRAILCGNEYEISLDFQPVTPWYQGSFHIDKTPIIVEPPLARNSAVVEAIVLHLRKDRKITLFKRGHIYGGSFSGSVPHMEVTIKIEYDPAKNTLNFEEIMDSHAWQGDR